MRTSPNKDGAPTPPRLLRPDEQRFLAGFVLVLLIALSVYFILRGLRRDDLIEIDHATPQSAEFKIVLNEATWPEIAQLPGIGETMARQIVAERQKGGAFRDLADLDDRVYGIGPTLVARVEPYVTIQPAVITVADSEND